MATLREQGQRPTDGPWDRCQPGDTLPRRFVFPRCRHGVGHCNLECDREDGHSGQHVAIYAPTSLVLAVKRTPDGRSTANERTTP